MFTGQAMAKDQIDPNQKVKLDVYNSQGKKTGTRTVKAKDLWQEVDSWQEETIQRYRSQNATQQVNALPTVFSNGERHEKWSVPPRAKPAVLTKKAS